VTNARRGRSGKRFYALLGAIGVLGIGALGYAATRRDAPAAAPRDVDPALAAEAQGHLMGRPDAPVQIIEFSDFECPYCAQFATVTEPDVRKRLVETGEVSFRYYDYPLDIHRNTWPASHAAACAEEQGKFWEMHGRIFAGLTEWNGQATSNPKGIFQGYARDLGLDVARWEQCFDSQKYLRKIQANKAEGDRRQIDGTPTFFVNDRKFVGIAYDKLKALVDSAKMDIAAGRAPAASAPAPGAPAAPAAGAPGAAAVPTPAPATPQP
jgi:protein-disulfide isomerase